MVLAKSEGEIYRAKVVSVDDNGETVRVRYVDYGNEEMLSTDQIYKWSSECDSVPHLGIICHIHLHLDKPLPLIPILLQSMQENLLDKQLKCQVANVQGEVLTLDISGWYKEMTLGHQFGKIWDRPGNSFFLGWTGDNNGTLAMIETTSQDCNDAFPSPEVKVLGNVGISMESSCKVAYMCAKQWVADNHPQNRFFDYNDVLINFPFYHINTDGPSAGGMIALAIISLALNRPLVMNIIGSCEIDSHANFLPVGGTDEELTAANAFGVLPTFASRMREIISSTIPKHVNVVPQFGKCRTTIKWLRTPCHRHCPKHNLDSSNMHWIAFDCFFFAFL